MYRRLLILSVALAVTGTLLLSCQQKEERIPVLTVPETMITSAGGTQTVAVAAESPWTLSVDYLDKQAGWITVSAASGSGFDSVTLTVAPNESDVPRSANLRLDTRSHTIRQGLTQAASVAHSMPGWMELPVPQDNPDLYFFTHDMKGGRYVSNSVSGTRNWSFYWDTDNYVSHWVAYPLNAGLLEGNYGRYDIFIDDPILTELGMMQPYLTPGSYGGGWTRGHQIPSADRQKADSNISTFYATNMTPQQYDFNCEIWAKLESKVRVYARNCDTLYVCTGCDIRNPLGYTGNRSGVSVAIPSAYYKALLRCKGNDWSAVGYYLPHSADISGNDFQMYSMSIEALENRTGVDFFANLPSFLGKEKAAAIEKADPNSTLNNW